MGALERTVSSLFRFEYGLMRQTSSFWTERVTNLSCNYCSSAVFLTQSAVARALGMQKKPSHEEDVVFRGFEEDRRLSDSFSP